ncbi:MAG: glycosyltransferase [Bacteroidota bacterium]|nr:glycosyltransferase [Bacteroidota bacterium]
MSQLFLFTNFFPHKKAEPFLTNEFEFTTNYYNTITILSLYGKKEDSIITENSQITVLKSVFEDPANKKQIFVSGIFNFSSFGFHLKEFFKKKLFLHPKKAYWFFVSFCITRSVLNSNGFKDILSKINTSDSSTLYFYWGDNLTWIIPYLRKKINNKNVEIITRLHGSDLYESVKNDYAPLREIIFKTTDKIVTVSENGEKYLKTKYPDFKNKISVARLGVFTNGLNPYVKKDNCTIVSVSNIIPLKRIHLIFELLQSCHSKIHWHHFGDGILMNELKHLTAQKRNGLTVELHGFVNNKQLINFYKSQSVDLFINVSTTEGVPVSIMEALSFGIPVFATNVGGTSELVNDGVGKILDSNFNNEHVSKQIDTFLSLSDSEIKTYRENAHRQFILLANAETNYNKFYNFIKNNKTS